VSTPTVRRRRRGQHETRPRPPAKTPAPERGATLNLQDPDAYIAWLTSNAEGFQENAKKNRDNARAIWAKAAEHDRNVQALTVQMQKKKAELDDLARQFEELSAQREAERQAQAMRAAEAKQLDDHAKNSENAAADIQASIPVIQQAAANGQSPATAPIDLDPKETARIDKSLAAIDAARAELPADQRDEDEL
jgi:predicted RNase H-like nuclease (RuvC/YqgF family)